jgi:hypothetical protein
MCGKHCANPHLTLTLTLCCAVLVVSGMMMNSIKANASFIIPRLGLMVVLLWVLWFFTNVIQTTWVVLCKQVGTHTNQRCQFLSMQQERICGQSANINTGGCCSCVGSLSSTWQVVFGPMRILTPPCNTF